MWSEILSKTIQEILLVMLPFIAASVTTYVIKLIQKIEAEIKNATDEEWLWLLDEGARIAVRAAEQLGLAGLIRDKKEYAMNFVRDFLASRGMNVDLNTISAAIEAAVLEEFNKAKLTNIQS